MLMGVEDHGPDPHFLLGEWCRALDLNDDMANISAQQCPHLRQFQQVGGGWGGGGALLVLPM